MAKKVPSKTAYKISYVISLIAGIFSLLIGIPTIKVGGFIFVLFGVFFLFFYYNYRKIWKNYDATYNKTKLADQEKFDDKIENLVIKTTAPVSSPAISLPENSLSFKVAGVTFKTGRKSRQVMLKNMYFQNTPPFDEGIEITFERYDYEGNLAIGVYANGLQIGNVPANLVETFDSYWTSNYEADFEVYGGGKKSWGCSIDVDFY